MTEQEADQILRSVPGYSWLLNDGRLFWSPTDLEPFIGFNANTIRRWVDAGLIPGALDFGSSGIRIPRGGLMVYLASKIAGGQQKHA